VQQPINRAINHEAGFAPGMKGWLIHQNPINVIPHFRIKDKNYRLKQTVNKHITKSNILCDLEKIKKNKENYL
jgi:hypothetical protein